MALTVVKYTISTSIPSRQMETAQALWVISTPSSAAKCPVVNLIDQIHVKWATWLANMAP
jgi:hypothetical protein